MRSLYEERKECLELGVAETRGVSGTTFRESDKELVEVL
jgi:hypothetical protein